jgi:ABC-type sugar transport system ATPase subunit
MILLEQLCVSSGAFRLQGIDLRIATGEYGVLMGKTGCGKSTLLEALCGLRPVHAGRIQLMDRDVTRLPPALREIGYVPQDLALFPSLRVGDHLAFALEVRRFSRAAIHDRVAEMAQMLGITHLLDRRPRGLSGGESQRVALGRALSFHPRVLLLDEPLSALDEDTRGEMIELLQSIQARTGVTTLHVTHSLSEARRLANRLFLVEQGSLRELPAVERHS